MNLPQLSILTTRPCKDYALLDSGEGEKLERYGKVTVVRPDPQALWAKTLPANVWRAADATFFPAEGGKKMEWQTSDKVPMRWQIALGGLTLWIKTTTFKHVGVFPEQAPNWDWIRTTISEAQRPVSVLNLFGYTGGASLAAAQAGAEVCHVDGSKTAIAWGKENAVLSGVGSKPIRWILDDARAFVQREIKRGRRYDGIVMDPPAFGHGPDKELWKIEDHFLDLMKLCEEVLTDQPLFFLINGYASGYSSLAYANNLHSVVEKHGGSVECGELTIAQEGSERLLPCGIFARWSAKA